ncbi:MAG TPA: TonB family protein [Steroidobacteraceae bacterium]|nr:TonB family protein [Steroidobacteraceae bacterium]
MVNGSPLQDFQGVALPPEETAAVREGLVVLTRDEALVATLERIGPEHDVFSVASEADLAAHLLAQYTGVALIDAGTLATAIERLTERLRAQFPDLVLIVAGDVDDQSALAAQITNGTVYRFLHKPVSEQRVRLFVEAAWRRHSEERAATAPIHSTAFPARSDIKGPNILMLGGAALAATAVIAGAVLWHKPATPPLQVAAPQPAEAPPVSSDGVLEDLLSRAAQAMASGALVSPPGASAADLYRRAQQRDPKDPRGANGIEKVIDRLLSNAEAQLLAQHLDEAQKLTDAARAIKPDHVRVAFLVAQIGKERERAVLARARAAAASGDIEQALAVLDSAGQRSTLVSQARQQLQQKQLDERVRDFLDRATDSMLRGDLIEPAQDNAQFYIESARALAPDSKEVRDTQQQLVDRIVSEGRKAVAAGNADQGEHWLQIATQAGADPGDLAMLQQGVERVRGAAKADALARLALLFNERLSQGKVLDPAADSAKSYLAQLLRADPTHPSTQLARKTYATRALEEAKSAVQRRDFAGAQRWLAEAGETGADAASITAINGNIKAAQETTAQAAPAASAASAAQVAGEVVPATALEMIRYVPPMFPTDAQERAQSGWVDLLFTVETNGFVGDLKVIGAEPAGLFEQSAIDAVRKWRYRPILHDGQPINQRARVRVRFALQQ